MSEEQIESGRSSEEPTSSPRSISHQELTTVAMDAACFGSNANLEGGGGGEALEAPDNRESPGEEEDEEDEEDEEEVEDEEEEDEEENSHSEMVTRKCVYDGCTETTTQVAKPRKPWMCKKHRNKTYKDKYKKRKNTNKSDDDMDERPTSVTKQRLSCMMTVHQASRKASLLEQVLNQKRLSLLRSPEVVQFLQQQQRLLSNQALAQRQQFQETPM
ncbi:regulatory factor X-associated protein [Heterodontus francisci]|uniref:regulatory factor X-associated protein n=1 Tax=Heterodontus francisci TaxID=7792 RepID=UPI00355AFA95